MPIVTCPKCRGTGFISQQSAAKREPFCNMCSGFKKVNTDIMCKCSRPAIQKINGLLVCTREDCVKRATDGKPSDEERYGMVC